MGVEQIIDIAVNIIIGLMGTIFLIAVVAGIIYLVLNRKRYDYLCKVYEYAGNNQLVLRENEKAGIFVDNKTKFKRFWLKQAKVGLSPDQVPYMINARGQKVVHLIKDGTKSFRFLDISILNDHKIQLTVTEEDVNWAVTDYERTKKIFQNDFLQKIMPYIGILLMGVFIVIMTAQLLRGLQEILPVLNEILNQLVQLKSGTTIIN